MYGIVNKSIEELVIHHYGEDKWEEIKEKSGVDIGYFISSEPYSDEVTFKLAQTISQELNISIGDVLRTFGEWWILHTGKNHYGYLLESGGSNFGEFMKNLPSFHNRIMMFYPKLTPPEFKITNAVDHSLHLHYISKRQGLTDFVYGLVSGLGKFFSAEVSVEHVESLSDHPTHEVLKVTWKD